MGRNYLVGTHGDAANAVLAAAGYNFRRLLEWLALLLSAILAALKTAATQQRPSKFKLGPRAFFSSSQATSYSAGSAARNTERDSRAHAVSMRDFFTPGKNLRDAQAS